MTGTADMQSQQHTTLTTFQSRPSASQPIPAKCPADDSHSSQQDAHPSGNPQDGHVVDVQKRSEQSEQLNRQLEGQEGCWVTAPVGPSAASLLHKLRWVALGPQFNWSTRQYENEPGIKPLPPQLVALAQHVVKACQGLPAAETLPAKPSHHACLSSHAEKTDNTQYASMHPIAEHRAHARHDAATDAMARHPSTDQSTQHPEYEPDTALVNFYREGDTLGGHKDDAELHGDCPIVSLSLGCDAVFLIGGKSRDVAPSAIWVHSGDAIVLSGPARQCYHGVPRVVPGHVLPGNRASGSRRCEQDIGAYMQSTRINISIRQT